jgi:DsbC/DsbD-like thiol-disulfide interchange protein
LKRDDEKYRPVQLLKAFGGIVILAMSCLSMSVADDGSERVQIQLISNVTSVPAKGKSFWLGLHQSIKPGWHTYWKYAGDSGFPTRIAWEKTKTVEIGEIVWPRPKTFKEGPLTSYGYEDEVLLMVPVTVMEDGLFQLAAEVELLVCKEVCIPQNKNVSIKLSPGPGERDQASSKLFKKFRSLVPVKLPWPSSIYKRGETLSYSIQVDKAIAEKMVSVQFFPGVDGLIKNGSHKKLTRTKDSITINMVGGYAIEEGLGTFEGILTLITNIDGLARERSYDVGPMPVSLENLY